MLGRIMSPLFGLLLVVVLYTVNSAASGYYGEIPSAEANVMYAVGFSLLLTWWVHVDRKKRRYPAPFEFGAFVFFAWIVVVPFYLIHTRRWKGLPLIGALFVALLLPSVAGRVAYGL